MRSLQKIPFWIYLGFFKHFKDWYYLIKAIILDLIFDQFLRIAFKCFVWDYFIWDYFVWDNFIWDYFDLGLSYSGTILSGTILWGTILLWDYFFWDYFGRGFLGGAILKGVILVGAILVPSLSWGAQVCVGSHCSLKTPIGLVKASKVVIGPFRPW